jgi:hypothetical protein
MSGYGFPQRPFPNSVPEDLFEIFCHESHVMSGGVRGVANDELMRRYQTALHSAYEIFTVYFKRPTPKMPIRVNIFHIGDVLPGALGGFSFLDSEDRPTICLPCGSGQKPSEFELYEAGAATFHELTHVFNWTKHDPRMSASQPWLWLDEALALLVESKYGAGLRVPRHPLSIKPNAFSLDDPHAEDLAALFANFLEAQTEGGLEAIFRIWDTDGEASSPAQAIEQREFLSCFHSFAKATFFDAGMFQENLASVCDILAPERTVWLALPSITHSFKGRLDHLCFNWYDCHIDPGAADELVIRLASSKWDRLMASAIPVEVGEDHHKKAGREHRLFGDDSDDLEPLSIPLNDTRGEPVLRIIFVISNCGTRGDEQIVQDAGPLGKLHAEDDDAADYELVVALR